MPQNGSTFVKYHRHLELISPIVRASELLLAIPPANRAKRTPVPDTTMQESTLLESNNSEAALEEEEGDTLLTAQSYASAKEFFRAAHTLTACRSAKARFMRVYNKFLVRHHSTALILH